MCKYLRGGRSPDQLEVSVSCVFNVYPLRQRQVLTRLWLYDYRRHSGYATKQQHKEEVEILDPTSFYRRWCGERYLMLAAGLAQTNEWIMLVLCVTQKEGSIKRSEFWVAFSSHSCLSAIWNPSWTLWVPQEPSVSLGMAPLSSTKRSIPR